MKKKCFFFKLNVSAFMVILFSCPQCPEIQFQNNCQSLFYFDCFPHGDEIVHFWMYENLGKSDGKTNFSVS